jgi:hypothetical protein
MARCTREGVIRLAEKINYKLGDTGRGKVILIKDDGDEINCKTYAKAYQYLYNKYRRINAKICLNS